MVRRCSAETPVVVGPARIEHDDLFLPRLQALQHLTRLAWMGGGRRLGLPTAVAPASLALWADAIPADAPSTTAPAQFPALLDSAAFNPEEKALVTRDPVASFEGLLQRLADWYRKAVRSSWTKTAQAVGLWSVHATLLACGAAAVALPAWRQPTLIALVAKMGADAFLALPAATQYDQRDLFRSLVPAELMLVLAYPLAGLWALASPALPNRLALSRAS
jgi:hypothetical protein